MSNIYDVYPRKKLHPAEVRVDHLRTHALPRRYIEDVPIVYIPTYTLYPSGSGREASRLKLQQNSNSADAAAAAALTTTQQYYTNNFRERVGPSLLLSPRQTGIIQLHTVCRKGDISHERSRTHTRNQNTLCSTAAALVSSSRL